MVSTDGVIITAAIVGAETMREHTPHIPYTPEEIAEEARRCRDSGASIAHVHGRRPDGQPTQDEQTFGQILSKIRERTDILVQFSTGGAVGMGVAERVKGLALRPDMATLTTGSVNFGDGVFLNDAPTIRAIAARLKQLGICPEVEIFDTGMVDEALRLIDEGWLVSPVHFDFVLGLRGGMRASARSLQFLVEMLPEQSTWSVAGIGRHELPMAYAALEMGGHVRVGLEDNIYIQRGELARGSWELVEAVVTRADEAGRPILEPSQAAHLLHIPRMPSPQTPIKPVS